MGPSRLHAALGSLLWEFTMVSTKRVRKTIRERIAANTKSYVIITGARFQFHAFVYDAWFSSTRVLSSSAHPDMAILKICETKERTLGEFTFWRLGQVHCSIAESILDLLPKRGPRVIASKPLWDAYTRDLARGVDWTQEAV